MLFPIFCSINCNPQCCAVQLPRLFLSLDGQVHRCGRTKLHHSLKFTISQNRRVGTLIRGRSLGMPASLTSFSICESLADTSEPKLKNRHPGNYQPGSRKSARMELHRAVLGKTSCAAALLKLFVCHSSSLECIDRANRSRRIGRVKEEASVPFRTHIQ